MASEIQIENQSPIGWQPVAGSLQAMNLGCMPLGQLGALVNWRNEQTFTAPDCKPWVELPLAAANTASVSMPSALASAEASKPVETPPTQSVQPSANDTEVMATPPSIESSVDENAAHDAMAKELAAQELAAKEEALQEAKAKEIAENAAKEEAEKAAASAREAAEIAAKEVTEREAKEAEAKEAAAKEAAAKEAAAKEAAAKEAAAREAVTRDVAEKQAVATEVAAESAPIPVSSNPSVLSATVETISKPILNRPTMPSIGEEIRTDNDPRRSVTSSTQLDRSRTADRLQPTAHIEALSLNLDETVSFPSSNPRAPRNATSNEDYLLQLERLVLELNMELGRSRGEPKPSDPMEQMANRIIALNLENLALREKLQRSLNPS